MEKIVFVKGFKNYFITNRGECLFYMENGVPVIVKPFLNKSGYKVVVMENDLGQKKRKTIHRLVAETFVDGYFEGAVVNHKDGNKLNNFANNLEWTTVKLNTQHAFETGLATNNHKKKAIVATNLENKKPYIFDSLNECCKKLSLDPKNVRKVVGTDKPYKNYIFWWL